MRAMFCATLLGALLNLQDAHAGWQGIDWGEDVETVLEMEDRKVRPTDPRERLQMPSSIYGETLAAMPHQTYFAEATAFLYFHEARGLSAVWMRLPDTKREALPYDHVLQMQYGTPDLVDHEQGHCGTTRTIWRDEDTDSVITLSEGCGSPDIFYVRSFGSDVSGL